MLGGGDDRGCERLTYWAVKCHCISHVPGGSDNGSRLHSALGDKSILPDRARNERVPRANLRAFISPLMGGRMVADGGSAPIGGRSADACPYGSE